MSTTTKIMLGLSGQRATSSTSQSLEDKGYDVDPKATRIRLAFDLNPANPLDAAAIARYTYDGQAATPTYGTQIQYGSILNLTQDEARNVQIISEAGAPAVNFMIDQFVVEQKSANMRD